MFSYVFSYIQLKEEEREKNKNLQPDIHACMQMYPNTFKVDTSDAYINDSIKKNLPPIETIMLLVSVRRPQSPKHVWGIRM